MTHTSASRTRDLRTIDPDNRTLRDVFQGEACWVKYAAVHARPFSSGVFNMMSRLSSAPVFRSTHNPDAIDALATEAKRLREMDQAGFCVPKVLEQERDHLVLSDVGKNVGTILSESTTALRRRSIVERVIDHLAAVHKAGLYHGRSVAKDLTITETGEIGMIDLEHEPLKVMPLQDAQSRDIWLLFLSAAQYQKQDPTLITAMADRYGRNSPARSMDALCDNVRTLETYLTKLRPFSRSVAPDSQIHAIFEMNRTLDRHLN